MFLYTSDLTFKFNYAYALDNARSSTHAHGLLLKSESFALGHQASALEEGTKST